MLNFQFFMPTRILFGNGSLEEIGNTPYLPRGDKAMVVITKGGTMLKRGYLARLQGFLSAQGVKSVVYDKVPPNPESDQVDEAAALCRDMGVDMVVGLGGGSAIDAAKAVALCAANTGGIWDYIPSGTGKGLVPENPALPIVAVPTTAGTGTEADPWFVVSKSGGREKTGFGLDSTFPALSVVDPELTLSVPPRLTALTGLDAFFHAVESYLNVNSQPVSDMLALEAAHLIAHTLPQAVEEPDNLRARTILSWASTAAGVCESLSGCISQHSLEHALTAFNPELPHGLGLAALSRPYFARLAEKAPERFDDLALAMGVDEVDELPEAERPGAFLAALDELLGRVGVASDRLGDWGFTPEDAEALADNAYETMGDLFDATPGDMTRQDAVDVLRAALA